ncbi:predicted protein [Plenodomus lingam JN3]|uniref:Predicted protein n=1 Tax=Leptosphaeria maculans (strain JN3 / isolate v23.1.3 / race Av1-4-5-6-7-8) TaxID=985895 RepID=E5A4Y0_LEPMJ|nr:predicted protein [Plenodomus lingam JN3]CBX98678.1 predicted protein [Plenodomus lingam JN3]
MDNRAKTLKEGNRHQPGRNPPSASVRILQVSVPTENP